MTAVPGRRRHVVAWRSAGEHQALDRRQAEVLRLAPGADLETSLPDPLQQLANYRIIDRLERDLPLAALDRRPCAKNGGRVVFDQFRNTRNKRLLARIARCKAVAAGNAFPARPLEIQRHQFIRNIISPTRDEIAPLQPMPRPVGIDPQSSPSPCSRPQPHMVHIERMQRSPLAGWADVFGRPQLHCLEQRRNHRRALCQSLALRNSQRACRRPHHLVYPDARYREA